MAIGNDRFELAAAAFENAQKAAGTADAEVDRLIHEAKSRLAVIPDEIRRGDPKAVIASAVATVYRRIGWHDHVEQIVGNLMNGRSATRSRPHRSYVLLQLAHCENARQQIDKAKTLYTQSLDEHDRGTWHDATLRELALLMEQTAEDKPSYGNTPPTSRGSGRPRIAAAAPAGRTQALPLWTKLYSRFPGSLYSPQALYHAAVLQGEAGKWHEALVAYDQLAREYPQSAWTGDAHVRLIDLHLERRYDLTAAEKHANAAIKWLEQLDQEKADAARSGIRSIKSVSYDIFVRMGLIHFLAERYDAAIALFNQATTHEPQRDLVVVQGDVPTGIEQLIEAAKSGKPLTPAAVFEGNAKVKLMLMLADIYYVGQQFEQSSGLCNQVLAQRTSDITNEQRSWAFFRRGRSVFGLDEQSRDVEAAAEDYLAAANTAPSAEWADNALFLAANIEWNFHQDADAAIALWKRLAEKYPSSDEGDRAAYYVGVAYQWSGRHEHAREAFEKFLVQRSNSRFASGARSRIQQLSAIPVSKK